MGLAPYGDPTYVDLIYKHLVDVKEDGSFHLDMSYFNYCTGFTMTSEKFHKLFGREPRKPESTITKMDMDLARSIQVVTEEIVLRIGRHIYKETGEKKQRPIKPQETVWVKYEENIRGKDVFIVHVQTNR